MILYQPIITDCKIIMCQKMVVYCICNFTISQIRYAEYKCGAKGNRKPMVRKALSYKTHEAQGTSDILSLKTIF